MKLYVKTRCRFLGLEVCGEKMRQKHVSVVQERSVKLNHLQLMN